MGFVEAKVVEVLENGGEGDMTGMTVGSVLKDPSLFRVLTFGTPLLPLFNSIAAFHPNITFTIIGATPTPTPPNINFITFPLHEIGFLAGIAAASVSKTRSVAIVGGSRPWYTQDTGWLNTFEMGFLSGVVKMDEGCSVWRFGKVEEMREGWEGVKESKCFSVSFRCFDFKRFFASLVYTFCFCGFWFMRFIFHDKKIRNAGL
ncbi:hypothetical protein BC829DRAFT_82159 [Chytridium lagenaria]|nr:hypothetical protein BC829DRAFT_82159 [Chytridium lagenaria]